MINTLRSEIGSLRLLLADDDLQWMGMDKGQRRNIDQLLQMALRAPDTEEKMATRVVRLQKTYGATLQLPIRNGLDYAAVVAESIAKTAAEAQQPEELGPNASLITFSHCFTMVPSPIAGAGALLYTFCAVYGATVTE